MINLMEKMENPLEIAEIARQLNMLYYTISDPAGILLTYEDERVGHMLPRVESALNKYNESTRDKFSRTY